MRTFESQIGKLLSGVAVVSALVFAAPVLGQDVRQGLEVVEKWCQLCHVATEQEETKDTAPTFQEIVKRPGRTKNYFRSFLDEDHFPMTTFRLFDHEKDAVVDYLMHIADQ
jgi:cytochrome c2